ncbi:MAG: nucleotidyltransferase domain-containing protein [Candidatus Methanofastidiosia archaeon]|jgi:predicted nucleotidyltransferase
MDKGDIERIKRDFKFLSDDVLAIVIYGSRAKKEETERSDIDICIVAPNTDKSEIFKETLHLDYDIKLFESMPLFLKMKVIQNHKIVYTQNILDFYEYLYFFRKLWKDQEHRQKMTKEEALHIFG